MKIRIKFQKSGPLRFIGHLDVMRFFQKAIRRAGLDIVYTGGFSPHQIMTFAAPLGAGLESEGEYMDIELATLKELIVLASDKNMRSDKHAPPLTMKQREVWSRYTTEIGKMIGGYKKFVDQHSK